MRRRKRRTAGPAVRGLTLDTGALIAFERADRAIASRLKEALEGGRPITIPTVVVVEAWRGGSRSARLGSLLEACRVEALLEPLARRAGALLAKTPGSTPIDAVVATSAEARGDVVVTSDIDDLLSLAAHCSGIDVVGIS
jgi:predicted nucleic acid-binding protein